MYRILMVEDDETISHEIKENLESWGYEVQETENFKDVMALFARFDPQLVLMDISLPFYNGYHWCAQIRQVSKVPVIFLSSASDNMNIVMAVNMGADDFVAKPFDLMVLMAKVQAMLRRTYEFAGQTNLIEHKGVILNISDASISYQGEKVELTKNEYKILQILMEHMGNTVSREAIMTRLWETDSYVDDNTLTVNVTRLRRKLEETGISDFIQTKKGMGYIIEQ
ncbi:MAG: response regulator transcription factor [Lachnospiraceae bacterium]|nr:response regulator transcription factor [Lachnospiraceae bacterium]